MKVRNLTAFCRQHEGLKRLNGGFQYENNTDLCGIGFMRLEVCSASDRKNPNKPEPFGPGNLSMKNIPESAKIPSNCSRSQAHCVTQSSTPQTGLALGIIDVAVVLALAGFLSLSIYRRRKQKIGGTFDSSNSRLSTAKLKEVYCRRSASPLISLKYSNGWDLLAKGGSISGGVVCGGLSQEVFKSFMYNLEDVEKATHCCSEINLLGKSGFSTPYKGTLRDGSVVAVKCIAKTSWRSDEDEFLKGLKFTSMKHEYLVRLRGFCCSKERGECFLIYEFVPNGNLQQHLDANHGSEQVLKWSTRVSIIAGIAEGIRCIHSSEGKKPGIVHQNISFKNVLLDHWNNPDSGLHKLLADDVVFSMLKASATMGYLAPEYTTTGRFTEKSDVYTFGMILLQVLCGKTKITPAARLAAEMCKLDEFVDANLNSNCSESQASKILYIALLCTHESANCRLTMENVVQELRGLGSSS